MYQYAAWPDHGVPSDSSSIRHLINLVQNERYKSKEIKFEEDRDYDSTKKNKREAFLM